MELTGCGDWWGWREEGEEEESQNELSGFFLKFKNILVPLSQFTALKEEHLWGLWEF